MQSGCARRITAGLFFIVFSVQSFPAALAENVLLGRSAEGETVCTIADEAKCWSPAEVDEALLLFTCGAEGAGQHCAAGIASLAGQLASSENPLMAEPKSPPAPAARKLDASGVPEFNAWEDGCD